MWAKTVIDPQSSASAGLLLQFLDDENEVISTAQAGIGGTTDWTPLVLNDIVAPAGSTNVRLSGFVSATNDGYANGGLVYYDDATLEKISQ